MKSLHKSASLLLCALLMLVLGGCTQNNGYIGDLFGTWRLDRLTCDGAPQVLYPGCESEGDEPGRIPELYTFSFQGSLIGVVAIYPHHDFSEAYGSFEHAGDILYLNFDHTDNDGGYMYTPPAALHLPDTLVPMNIEKLTSSEMHIWYVSDDGKRYDYYLNKAF